MNYTWKGNVREIKHIIENMVSISEEKILTVKNLPIYMKDIITWETEDVKHKKNVGEIPQEEAFSFLSLNETIVNAEKQAIVRALMYTEGHITKASELLSLPRQTLKYKMNKLGIKSSDYKKS